MSVSQQKRRPPSTTGPSGPAGGVLSVDARPALRNYKRMLKVRVIPCLDVKDGRTVKGVNFVDLRDAGDPVALARAYDRQGADELCFLDITASVEGRGAMIDVIERTADACFMPLTVGGGVRTPDDMVAMLK